MDVSIVVTCYNEEKKIGPCLESLCAQDYADGPVEIIVADGASLDETQEIVNRFAAKDPRVRLVVEPKRGTAAGRNRGIRESRYGHVAFIDADCEAPGDWLKVLVNRYQEEKKQHPSLVAVGGRNISPRDGDAFVRSLEIALDSYLGSFSSVQGRQFQKPAFVESLATLNVLYDRSAIIAVGGFDETLGSEAEDADLNYRLKVKGHALLYLPESFVWHRMRPTPAFWFRNMFRYGKGRARLLKRYPAMRSFRFALPLLFIVAMAILPLGIFWRIFLLPLVYFPGIALFSIFLAARKKELRLSPVVAAIYVLQHCSYAAGELYGLLNRRVR